MFGLRYLPCIEVEARKIQLQLRFAKSSEVNLGKGYALTPKFCGVCAIDNAYGSGQLVLPRFIGLWFWEGTSLFIFRFCLPPSQGERRQPIAQPQRGHVWVQAAPSFEIEPEKCSPTLSCLRAVSSCFISTSHHRWTVYFESFAFFLNPNSLFST